MVPPDKPESAERRPDADRWALLMAAAQEGDRDAYRTLLIAVTPYIRGIAGRSLREPADVEDAVQDVLIALHEARATFDPTRPFKPWLIGIARHRIIDRVRVRARNAAREVSIEPEHETFSQVAPNQDDMNLDRHALHGALAQLPPNQRVAVEELKLRESSLLAVSARTGMSVAALKVATHRGIKRLRQVLTGKDEP